MYYSQQYVPGPIPVPPLPHEILLEILFHLAMPSFDQQDLMSFASVSPTWNNVVTPLLRRINIGYACRGDLFCSLASLYAFFAVDNHADAVQEVCVGFKHLMDAAKLPAGANWVGAEYGFPSRRMAMVDATVELLKLLGPFEAFRLDLENVEEEDYVILKYFFSRLHDESVFSYELKQLEFGHWIELDAGNQWIASLPGLDRVVVNGWVEGEADGLGEALSRTKGVKHAAIEGNDGISLEMVGRMVSRWGSLVSLNVEGSLNLTGATLLKIIAKVCRRLEHLWMGVAEIDFEETEESASAVESVLVGCTKLRTLCAPRYRRIKDRTLRAILKHGNSLETLDLRGCPVTGVVPPEETVEQLERTSSTSSTSSISSISSISSSSSTSSTGSNDWRRRFEGKFGPSVETEKRRSPQPSPSSSTSSIRRRGGTEIQTINTPKLKHLGLDSPTLRPQLARRIMLACPQLVEFVVDEKCKSVLPAHIGRTNGGEAFEKALGGVFLESVFN